jgi:hypothetical protein
LALNRFCRRSSPTRVNPDDREAQLIAPEETLDP